MLRLVLNGPGGSDCLCTDCVPAVFQYLNTQVLVPCCVNSLPRILYTKSNLWIYKGNHSASKKGLYKALRLKEVAPVNSVVSLNITMMFELIYKSHRSLCDNLYSLWSWKREQKPWWHSLYINLKLLQFLYLAPSYSLNSFAIYESKTSSKEIWAM